MRKPAFLVGLSIIGDDRALEHQIRSVLGALDVAYTHSRRILLANPEITSEQRHLIGEAERQWNQTRRNIWALMVDNMQGAKEATEEQIVIYRTNYEIAQRQYGPMMERFEAYFLPPNQLDDLLAGRPLPMTLPVVPPTDNKPKVGLILGIAAAFGLGIALLSQK